jgi:hypothetical protein
MPNNDLDAQKAEPTQKKVPKSQFLFHGLAFAGTIGALISIIVTIHYAHQSNNNGLGALAVFLLLLVAFMTTAAITAISLLKKKWRSKQTTTPPKSEDKKDDSKTKKSHSKIRSLLWTVAVIVVLFLIIRVWRAESSQPSMARIDENPIVCPNSWDQEAKGFGDYENKEIPFFDVILTGDVCFPENIIPPKKWHTWEKEFITNGADDHISFWFWGSNPIGPYGRNNLPTFDSRPRKWRLKGRGTIRYFRTS